MNRSEARIKLHQKQKERKKWGKNVFWKSVNAPVGICCSNDRLLGNVLDWISLTVSPQAMLLLIILGIPVEVCKMRI